MSHQWTPASRAKLRASLTGRTIPPDVRAKISANAPRIWAGKKMSAAACLKMSEAKRGVVPWNKGKKCPTMALSDPQREARRKRLVGVRVGALNPCWKGGVTPVRTRIWRSSAYQEWRRRVFTQDSYSCRLCGAKSGNGKALRLEADHFPIPFVAYLDRLAVEVEPSQMYEAALRDRGLWAADGRALCAGCHNKTKRGRGTHGYRKAAAA